MFNIDSNALGVLYDEEKNIESLIIHTDVIAIEIPLFSIESEKRTATAIWVWLGKLHENLSQSMKKFKIKDESERNVVLTILSLSEFINHLGHLFPYQGFTIDDLKREIDNANLFPFISPDGGFLIIRDDLHLEYTTDENHWERIVCGAAIYSIMLSCLNITESQAIHESKEITKQIPLKPKIPTHATALGLIGLLEKE